MNKKGTKTYVLVRELQILSDLVLEVANSVTHTHGHGSASDEVADVRVQVSLNVARKGRVGRSLVVLDSLMKRKKNTCEHLARTANTQS